MSVWDLFGAKLFVLLYKREGIFFQNGCGFAIIDGRYSLHDEGESRNFVREGKDPKKGKVSE
tara:strand:+ start:2132 stop:2317 length:186 start_codon:yes stop_codon:yes gene_type:complete